MKTETHTQAFERLMRAFDDRYWVGAFDIEGGEQKSRNRQGFADWIAGADDLAGADSAATLLAWEEITAKVVWL